jgi:hypothetical protein
MAFKIRINVKLNFVVRLNYKSLHAIKKNNSDVFEVGQNDILVPAIKFCQNT